MKNITAYLTFALFVAIIYSCGGNKETKTEETTTSTTEQTTQTAQSPESYDPKRGEGKWNSENVKVGSSLDASMATKGEAIASTKCTSCHKLSDEKLVGPGWKGVTTRRSPEWIMNFITNPDPMIDKDPAVQASLEICLVRMPNQNLADEDARNILEFMRKNDGVK